MSEILDAVIVGAGPGGLTAAIKLKELGRRCVVIEKGRRLMQGIIDSYPKGKPVYPTISKGATAPFPIASLTPPESKVAVEDYVAMVEAAVIDIGLNIRYNEVYEDLSHQKNLFLVRTHSEAYHSRHVIFAFGSNIPNDLGIYGEAKTVARNLENVEAYIGRTVLVIGGGNAAADVAATLSKAKRQAGDARPVFWAHIKEKFEINKDTARDLGEEILLGGQIKILQGAIPKIGEVDSEGIDRLYIHQTPGSHARDDIFMYQGMSFPMKDVIACVGTHGPAPVFNRLHLQQITCTGNICKIAKEGEQLLLLTQQLETSRRGIFAIGGSISPSYMEIQGDGTIREKKHPNLIYTAMSDAITAVEAIMAET